MVSLFASSEFGDSIVVASTPVRTRSITDACTPTSTVSSTGAVVSLPIGGVVRAGVRAAVSFSPSRAARRRAPRTRARIRSTTPRRRLSGIGKNSLFARTISRVFARVKHRSNLCVGWLSRSARAAASTVSSTRSSDVRVVAARNASKHATAALSSAPRSSSRSSSLVSSSTAGIARETATRVDE